MRHNIWAAECTATSGAQPFMPHCYAFPDLFSGGTGIMVECGRFVAMVTVAACQPKVSCLRLAAISYHEEWCKHEGDTGIAVLHVMTGGQLQEIQPT